MADGSVNLSATFHVGQDSQTLSATFDVGQDSEDLKATFRQNAMAANSVIQGVGVDVYVAMSIVI